MAASLSPAPSSSAPSKEPERAPERAPRSPLRHAAYRAVWIAAIFSYIGNWLQDVGESWTMLGLTSSPMLVAMVTTSFTIPCFVLMLPAGVLSDRIDRRKLLIGAQASLVVVAAVLSIFTALRIINPGIILACSACLGIGSALTTPAWQTLVPELVPRREMPEAVTLNSVAFNIARAIGPALAGLIIAASGPAVAFGLNALSFLAVIHVLRSYPEVKRVAEKPRPRPKNGTDGESFVRAMITAVKHAHSSTPLRACYASISAFAIMAASVPALLPVFAKQTLHADEKGYGILLGALGFGAVAGAFLLRRIRSMVSARALVAGNMAIYGVSVVAMTLAPSFTLAVVMLVPAGVGWLCSLSTLNALVQLSSPRWVKSRTMALYQLAFLLFWSIGASIGGAVATEIGAPITMRVAALGVIAAAAVTMFLRLPATTTTPIAPTRATR